MTKKIILVFFLFFSPYLVAQQVNKNSTFWDKVRWGGTGGANFSNRFSTISISPQGIYPVNSYYSTGLGLQYSYFDRNNRFTSHLYGGSFLNFFNPLAELQLSAELEQLRVKTKFTNGETDEFWNTALFFGAGYRQGNIIIGIRYNVLFDDNNRVYPEAWAPFVRIYF